MWTIFKVFIEFVRISLLFYVLVFWLWGMWDFSVLTRDRTRTPYIGTLSLNHWTAREVPWPFSFNLYVSIFKVGFLQTTCSWVLFIDPLWLCLSFNWCIWNIDIQSNYWYSRINIYHICYFFYLFFAPVFVFHSSSAFCVFLFFLFGHAVQLVGS